MAATILQNLPTTPTRVAALHCTIHWSNKHNTNKYRQWLQQLCGIYPRHPPKSRSHCLHHRPKQRHKQHTDPAMAATIMQNFPTFWPQKISLNTSFSKENLESQVACKHRKAIFGPKPGSEQSLSMVFSTSESNSSQLTGAAQPV